MKKLVAILSMLLIFSILFVSCNSDETPTEPTENGGLSESSSESGNQNANEGVSAGDKGLMFTERDSRAEYDKSTCVLINLNADSISCSSKAVNIKETIATITDEGTYVVTGTLNDGMIAVNAGETDKVQIVLNGTSITSSTSAAIYVINADKVFVTLADGSKNVLANGGSFVPVDSNNIDATVYSTQDLSFNGNGSLTVTSPAGHGIATKDDLVLAGGTYNVTALLRGLDANDSVRVKDSTVSVKSDKDGIRAENVDDKSKGFVCIQSGTINVTSKGDGISSSSYMQIDGGKLKISTESVDTTVSTKALKSGTDIFIDGGELNLTAIDDAINANQKVCVNNGIVKIATEDDAINATELLKISGGTVNVTECYEGVDSPNVEITGGKIDIVAQNDAIAVAVKDTAATIQEGACLIEDGEITLKAGGDGIDVKGDLTVTGGKTVVYASRLGSSSILSCDGVVTLDGGTLIGLGWFNTTATYAEDGNAFISLTVTECEAGKSVSVTDKDEKEILKITVGYSFAEIFISAPELSQGADYTILIDSESQTAKAQ